MASTQPPARIYRIKKGKLSRWHAWCTKLNTSLRKEALQTLREENIAYEFFITEELFGEYYAIGVAITPDGKNPRKANDGIPINEEHRSIKRECLEPVGVGYLSYFLDSTDSSN